MCSIMVGLSPHQISVPRLLDHEFWRAKVSCAKFLSCSVMVMSYGEEVIKISVILIPFLGLTYAKNSCDGIFFFLFLQTWIKMFQSIPHFNPATIIISVVAIFFLVIFKILNKLLKSPKVKVPIKVYRSSEKQWVKKRVPWPIPIPSQLIVVSLHSIPWWYVYTWNPFHRQLI